MYQLPYIFYSKLIAVTVYYIYQHTFIVLLWHYYNSNKSPTFFSLSLLKCYTINALVHLLLFSEMKKNYKNINAQTWVPFFCLKLARSTSCCYFMRTFSMYHYQPESTTVWIWYHQNGLHILNQLLPQVALSISIFTILCTCTSIKFCCDAEERAHIIKKEGKGSWKYKETLVHQKQP